MKKLILFSLIATSALFTFYSCQKETMEKPSAPEQENTAQKNQGTSLISHLVPKLEFINKQVDAPGCYSVGHQCYIDLTANASMKRSRIRWSLNTSATSTIYYYTIYKKANTLGGYTNYNRVDTFGCNETSGVWYSRSALASNSTTFIIATTTATTPLPSAIKEDGNGYLYTTSGGFLNENANWKFTTGPGPGRCIPGQ